MTIFGCRKYIITAILIISVFSMVFCTQPTCVDCSKDTGQNIKFQGKIFLVIGESQKGKSSFVRDVTGSSVPIAKYGAGNSHTSAISSYKSVKHLKGAIFIDTIGTQRTDLLEEQAIHLELQEYLKELEGGVLSGIILIESYLGDTSSIARQIKQISNIFGKTISKSIAVFMTKRNMITDEKYCKKRKSEVDVVAKKLGVSAKVIDIQTSYNILPSIYNEEEQVKAIAGILEGLRPIEVKYIQEKNAWIEKRSQQIQIQGKKVHNLKESCLTGDGHGLAIFNGKKHLDETIAYFQQYPPIEQCKRKAKQQLMEKIRQKLKQK